MVSCGTPASDLIAYRSQLVINLIPILRELRAICRGMTNSERIVSKHILRQMSAL